MILSEATRLWPVQNWEVGTSHLWFCPSPTSFLSIVGGIDSSPALCSLGSCLLPTCHMLCYKKIPNSVFLTEPSTAFVWNFKSKWHLRGTVSWALTVLSPISQLSAEWVNNDVGFHLWKSALHGSWVTNAGILRRYSCLTKWHHYPRPTK